MSAAGWVLGIDTSSAQLDLALVSGGAAACSYARHLAGSHAEHIGEAVDFILKSARIGAGDICAAGVSAGPGSFTGLRIGIAFVKGFFLSRDARVLPVSSLEATARAWGGAPGRFAVAFDARQGRVFGAHFARENGRVCRVSSDTLYDAAAFAQGLADGETVLADTLGFRASTLAQSMGAKADVRLLGSGLWVQRGLAAAMMASEAMEKNEGLVSPQDLLPQYLQESAAEERRIQVKAQGQGDGSI